MYRNFNITHPYGSLYYMYTHVLYYTCMSSLSQSANPGSVKCLEVCPADPKFLLIGYDKGVICLWDINRGLPTKNFPASIQDCQQVREVSLMCMSYVLPQLTCLTSFTCFSCYSFDGIISNTMGQF